MKISRPALRYHGAKWLLAPWIIKHLPGHHDLYCEPFGGSGGVLLRKKRSPLEVFNDLDDEVVNFFRVLREQEDELVRAIRFTPYAVKEWEAAGEPDPDPLESARRFFVRSVMSIAGPTAQWRTGFRRQKVLTKKNGKKKMTPAAISFMRIEHLHQVADRLRGVTIECDDALDLMVRYDGDRALFYVDPPYVAETRGRWARHAYSHELSDGDHVRLAEVLHGLEGMVVISGYRCGLYDGLFGDWERFDRVSRVNGPGSAVESLWLSPRALKGLKRPRQMGLL